MFNNKKLLREMNKQEKQQKIHLKIENRSQKLKPHFPKDPRFDVKIKFMSKYYYLQKAHLRIYSQFFAQKSQNSSNEIIIDQNFPEQHFQNILSLFYGHEVDANLSQIPSYYAISKYLKIQCLIFKLKQIILSKIDKSNIFAIFALADKYSDQELFEAAINQLEKEGFQQLKYQTDQLHKINISLLKLIIKIHSNYRKNHKKGLTNDQINQLIQKYSIQANLSEEVLHNLKFDIIDINSMNSCEYKKMFIDPGVQNYSKLTKNDFNSLESNQLRLQLKNNFERKRNNQLSQQNDQLQKQVKALKRLQAENKNSHQQMRKELLDLRKQLSKRQQTNVKQNNIIQRYEQMFNLMQGELQKKVEEIDILESKFQKIKKQAANNTPTISVQNNIYVQSQYLPSHLIGNIMQGKPFEAKNTGKKSQTSQDTNNKNNLVKSNGQNKLADEDFAKLYNSQIQFDQEPITISKKQILKLGSFINANSFNKKSLHLLYRCSKTGQSKGSLKNINNKGKILILISNEYGQRIGGFVQIPISMQKMGYGCDENAFIFTLTKGEKFHINPISRQQAILLSNSRLLSFANDLIISKDLLKEKSFCYWPNSYLPNGIQKQQAAAWFAGGKEFLINDFQAYQVKDSQTQMVL